MKKFIFGAIAGVAILLMVMYCSTGEKKASTWKPQKKRGDNLAEVGYIRVYQSDFQGGVS